MGVFPKIAVFFLCLLSAVLSAQNKKEIWWKETVFYEIYMPSYADSNGDGYGDFNGITSKLDYLQHLGIKGIWLTPFLKSPKVDNGYDVADYYAIDPVYGSMQDFEHFLQEARKRNIKVIMDMVLNHTSTESEWFREARKAKDNPYRDYYIWKDVPNNWESFFGGTAWKFDTLTQQYYYHKFDTRMADLNWQSEKVREEIKKVLAFWLEKGVDGFRLDVINFLTTDGIVKDNPVTDGSQQHLYDIDQPGVKEAIKMIRSFVNRYPGKFLVGEIGSDKIDILKQYQSDALLDVVFNFNFGSIPEFSAERLYAELKAMEENMPGYPTLFFGSHDMPRLADRLANSDTERAKALAVLMLTAKGIPFVYYGEEIGMHNITADDYSEIADIQAKTHYALAIKDGKTTEGALDEANHHNRDKSRSPMQWTHAKYAGFSDANSWIKINPDHTSINVEELSADADSLLSFYSQLIALRNKHKALQYGKYDALNFKDGLFTFTRTYKGETIYIAINFGKIKPAELPAGGHILMGNARPGENQFVIYTLPHK